MSYWKVECLRCGRESVVSERAIRKGKVCQKCRAETTTYKALRIKKL